MNPPWHVRLARRLYILFFYGFAAGPFAMTLGVIVATAAAVSSVSYTIGLKVVIDAIVVGHGRGVAEGTLLVGALFAVSWTLNGLSAMTAFYIGNLCAGFFDLAATPAQASELRSFGLRAEIARRHQSLNAKVRHQVVRSVVIGALESGAGWVVYGAGFAGAIVLLAIRAVHGQTSYGDVVMVAALIQRTQQQMSQVSSALSQIATNSRAAQYLFWLQNHHRSVRRVSSNRTIAAKVCPAGGRPGSRPPL